MSAVQDPRTLSVFPKLKKRDQEKLVKNWEALQTHTRAVYAQNPELKKLDRAVYKLPAAPLKADRNANGINILIQAGHVNTQTNIDPGLRGSTGAPGEVKFTLDVANQVSAILRSKGFTVKQTDANANSDSTVMNKDWRLALSIHYEADIHNTNGGFEACPDPSVDSASSESQRIAKFFPNDYFTVLGLPRHTEWRNANTSYYYLWRYLSAKTPCVLVECGVGWRQPNDYNLLNTDDGRKKVAEKLARSVCSAFGVAFDDPAPTPNPTPAPVDSLPAWFKQLLAERNLDINNEGQIRGYFGQADDFVKVNKSLSDALAKLDQINALSKR